MIKPQGIFFFKIKNVKSTLSYKSSNAVNFKSKRISIQKNEQDDEIYGKEGSGSEISEKMNFLHHPYQKNLINFTNLIHLHPFLLI